MLPQKEQRMRTCVFLVLIALSANAQEKPRVFVHGKGSENVSSVGTGGGGRHWGSWGSKATIDSHDESIEVTKNLNTNCPGVIITINEANADYVVMLNRESKQNRGLLRTNSQIQVANRLGDIVATRATRTVGNASKDACNLILADWQAHGRLNVQQTAPIPPSRPQAVQPAVQTSPDVQPAPAAIVPQSVPTSADIPVAGATSDSVDEAAKKEKQREDCLALAQNNPSITCK